MRFATVVMVAFMMASRPAVAHDDRLIPMPADVAPHHKGFIASDRHYDIVGRPESVQHFGDHFVSYGQHNFDMSSDPSRVHEYPYWKNRYRGMGMGDEERQTVLRRQFSEIDQEPARPWVERNAWKRGLRYALPPDQVEGSAERVDFPRPSWYVIYAKRPRR